MKAGRSANRLDPVEKYWYDCLAVNKVSQRREREKIMIKNIIDL